MYSRLIEDHPYDRVEQRSSSKSVFTLPLVLLFALVGIASTRHLMNANANSSLESMVAEPVGGDDVVAGAPGTNVVGGAPGTNAVTAPAAGGDQWWYLHKCIADTKYDCKVILTLDMGSSGTKMALWAIRQDDKKKIPDIHLAASKDSAKLKFKGFCGIWADKDQHMGDIRDYCDAKEIEKEVQETDTAYPYDCAGLSDNFEAWKEHFNRQMTCFLDKRLKSGPATPGPAKKIQEYISETYGGITAGLRNDPNIRAKFAAFKESHGPGTGGYVWKLIKTKTRKPVHIRMISGEEEGYYEWLSFNWDTLRKFENSDEAKRMEVTSELKNTLTIGGASAQIAIPTAEPMSTLDHTYYFHIGDDKYWIYANSIMWAGSKRLKTMVEEYETASTAEPLNDDFFNKNDKLLCSDIVNIPTTTSPAEAPSTSTTPTLGERQLYQGVCVMGFHFPSASQWLTNKFVGNKKFHRLTGLQNTPAGCMVAGSETNSVKLNFNDKCDNLDSVKDAPTLQVPPFFIINFPETLLPFWGRFWNKLIQAESFNPMLELKEGKEKNWSAVWAAMWLHGRFQGFPNLEKRRNLGGLKGEYTLGPLTFPAHFGTPEDSS